MVASPGPRPWIGLVISRHVGSRRHRGEAYAVVHSAGRWTPHARLMTCQLAPVRASPAMRTTSSRATGASAAAITASVRSAGIRFESKVSEVLQSVLDTEITPELVPSGEEEELQSSEANVGSFALRDFSLFQVLRYGFRPSKIGFLAWHAWSDSDRGNWSPGFPDNKRPSYSLKEIRHWLQVFMQRGSTRSAS
jgi:hypothetical protein